MSLHLNRQCQRANVFFPRSLWFRAPVDPTGRDAKRRATRVGRPRCCEVAYMVRFSPRQCLFFEAFRKSTLPHKLTARGEPFTAAPDFLASPGGERSIRLTFLVEEAADQPVCPVLPNTGPRPLRPLLKPHLVAALIRASPQVQVFTRFLKVARESIYRAWLESFVGCRFQADWM